jgi:hypothetical protein
VLHRHVAAVDAENDDVPDPEAGWRLDAGAAFAEVDRLDVLDLSPPTDPRQRGGQSDGESVVAAALGLDP